MARWWVSHRCMCRRWWYTWTPDSSTRRSCWKMKVRDKIMSHVCVCVCVCVCLGFLSPHHWTFAGFSNGGMGYLFRVCVFQAPVLFLSLWNFRGNRYDSNKLFRICVCVHFQLLLPCHCQPLLFAVYLAQEERLKNVWYLESWAVIWFLFPVSYLLSCFYTYSFCSLCLVILHFSRNLPVFFIFRYWDRHFWYGSWWAARRYFLWQLTV